MTHAARMPEAGARRGRRRGSHAAPCWCRRRGAGTPRRWPASDAARRPAAPCAPGPLAVAGPAVPPGLPLVRHGRRRLGLCRVRPPRSPGAGGRASGVRPRSSAGPSRRRRSWPRAATTCVASVPDRPAVVVATPEPSRWPPAGTPPWCCSTPGCPGPARPAHRRGGAPPVAAAPPGWSPRVATCSSVGDPAHPALQALVRWDPAGFADREASARSEAHLPPASRLATITGEPGAVDDALTLLDRPPGTEVLGPVEVGRRRVARWWSGCRARTGPCFPVPWARCSACARPASSTRSASRSTRCPSHEVLPGMCPP